MLTPQEVAEHAFQKASFGGYNMAMVDEFLDQVTADYTSLYKENATLKAKMKVLADKIEEYRSTEEAMRKAMLSAQRMADQMVAEAEEKVDTIIAEAEAQAREKITSIRQEVESEQLRLTGDQCGRCHRLCRGKGIGGGASRRGAHPAVYASGGGRGPGAGGGERGRPHRL